MQITINNEVFKLVEYDCSPSFVEMGDRVETLDGVTHVEKRKIKRNISATTIDLVRSDGYRLMQVLKEPYQVITYQDFISDKEETRIFLLDNSPQLTKKFWKNDRQYYSGAELEFLEKGAE